MSWNGSNRNSSQNKSEAAKVVGITKSRRCLLWSLAIAVTGLVVFAFWLAYRDSGKSVATNSSPKSKLIKAVAPAATNLASKSAAAKTMSAPPDMSKLSPAWKKYYDGRDTNLWIVVSNPVTHCEYISRIVKPGLKNAPPPLYQSHALNVLDAIAFLPIRKVMSGVKIDERYMRSLQDGLIEKIEIKPDDPEDVRSRKEGMIELKKELLQRLKNGEDLKTVINDSLRERNKIASLKQMMVSERSKMRRDGASEADIEAFEDACNKKLVESGATPMVTKSQLLKYVHQRAKNDIKE